MFSMSPGGESGEQLRSRVVPAVEAALEGIENGTVVIVGQPGPAEDAADRTVRLDEPPADVAWLGRHLSRTKLGLALGAGGAKGYAHVGALRVLEDAGYTVDYVSGSSIGAMVGAWLALGHDSHEIELERSRMAVAAAGGDADDGSVGGGDGERAAVAGVDVALEAGDGVAERALAHPVAADHGENAGAEWRSS
jgi:hypothetical protein